MGAYDCYKRLVGFGTSHTEMALVATINWVAFLFCIVVLINCSTSQADPHGAISKTNSLWTDCSKYKSLLTVGLFCKSL